MIFLNFKCITYCLNYLLKITYLPLGAFWQPSTLFASAATYGGLRKLSLIFTRRPRGVKYQHNINKRIFLRLTTLKATNVQLSNLNKDGKSF